MVDISQTLAAQKYANMAKQMQGLKGSEDLSANKQMLGGQASFGDLVREGVSEAIQASRKSEAMSAKAITGEAELTDVVDAVTRAEVALNTVLSVRDRMVSAFQEVLRTQI
tara:strand:- start:882 stop:1214 length:333 start_codon:yes stop_codon:yes gene_type:complete